MDTVELSSKMEALSNLNIKMEYGSKIFRQTLIYLEFSNFRYFKMCKIYVF